MSARMTEWEAHQVAELANRVNYKGGSWYVSQTDYGSSEFNVRNSEDAGCLDSDDLGELAAIKATRP